MRHGPFHIVHLECLKASDPVVSLNVAHWRVVSYALVPACSVWKCVCCRDENKRWHTVFEVSAFSGVCGHLTAGWGRRRGLNFPGVCFHTEHPVLSAGVEPLPSFLSVHLQLNVVNVLLWVAGRCLYIPPAIWTHCSNVCLYCRTSKKESFHFLWLKL